MTPAPPSEVVAAYLDLCERLRRKPTTREMSKRLGYSSAQIQYALEVLRVEQELVDAFTSPSSSQEES